MSSAISSVSSASAATQTTDSEALLPTQTLDQADFLKLLVAQLSSQDPMNPQSNADFAAQMAQFSALQTSQTTQSEITLLRAEQQVLQANGLIGREVTLQTGESGVVDAVQMESGIPLLLIGGATYNLNQILFIQPPTPTPST